MRFWARTQTIHGSLITDAMFLGRIVAAALKPHVGKIAFKIRQSVAHRCRPSSRLLETP